MAEKRKNKPGAGRPPKYTDEVLEALATELIDWFGESQNLWLKDFAISKSMPWQHFCELAAKNEKFMVALKLAHDMQEAKLFRLGLSKKVNASMAIFALKNVAGWRDTQDITTSGEITLKVRYVDTPKQDEAV